MAGTSVSEVIAQAAGAVARRPDGHLPMPVRDDVIRRAVAGRARPVAALVALDAIVISQVAYLAEGQAEAVRAVTAGLVDLAHDGSRVEDLLDRQDRCQQMADEALESGDQMLTIVWLAAGAAMARALTAEYRPDAPPVTVDDEQLDPDWWEPSFSASIAASGGVPSSPNGNRELRRRYWWWWLREAVPSAVGIGLDPGLVDRSANPAPLTDRSARSRAQTRPVDRETVAGLERKLAHRASAGSSWDRDDLVALAYSERLLAQDGDRRPATGE